MSAPKHRMMYIQRGWGAGRIGRVQLSKSGRSLYYGALELSSLSGSGYKANYIDTATGETYWVSGPRKDGQDTLYTGVVEIDEDVREAYWLEVRKQPALVAERAFRSRGVHGRGATR